VLLLEEGRWTVSARCDCPSRAVVYLHVVVVSWAEGGGGAAAAAMQRSSGARMFLFLRPQEATTRG